MAKNLKPRKDSLVALTRKYANNNECVRFFFDMKCGTMSRKSTSQGYHKQGCATEQQPFLCLLSTDRENSYPKYIKLFAIPRDNSFHVVRFIRRSAVLSGNRTLNTDGKTIFENLREDLLLRSEKIIYSEENHRLK